MKKIIILLLSALLLLPLSVSAEHGKVKRGSKKELPHFTMYQLSDEEVAKLKKEGFKEIGTQETRTHDAEEMKIIQDNPEGFSKATGEIFTDEEMRQLKEQVGAYKEEPSTDTEGDFHTNVIIGSDDRIRITDTTVFPYRRIALLYYNHPIDGKFYVCTGAIIDDNTVLTAAHCLYDTYHNTYMTNMAVYPGFNVDDAPYGSVAASNLIVTNAWASKVAPAPRKMTYDMIPVDYGVVKVPAGSFPANLGYFQLQAASGVGNQINVTGYPYDKEPELSMWRGLGNIISFGTYGNDAMYNHSADAMKGQSGGPNFNSPNGSDFYILGVNSAEGNDWNYSCDMTSTSIANINVWK